MLAYDPARSLQKYLVRIMCVMLSKELWWVKGGMC